MGQESLVDSGAWEAATLTTLCGVALAGSDLACP